MISTMVARAELTRDKLVIKTLHGVEEISLRELLEDLCKVASARLRYLQDAGLETWATAGTVVGEVLAAFALIVQTLLSAVENRGRARIATVSTRGEPTVSEAWPSALVYNIFTELGTVDGVVLAEAQHLASKWFSKIHKIEILLAQSSDTTGSS